MCNVKHNAITFFFSKWEISLHKINFQVFRDLFFSSSELIFLCGNLNILSFKFLYHRNIIFKKNGKKTKKILQIPFIFPKLLHVLIYNYSLCFT